MPVPIASMGDIAFLLIIFFMVCSKISKDNSNVTVVLPWSEYVEENDDQIVSRIAMDGDGQIFMDGFLVDGPKDVEWGLRALLTDTVSDDQRKVQFKADTNLVKEQFEPVLEAITTAGGQLMAVGENTPQN